MLYYVWYEDIASIFLRGWGYIKEQWIYVCMSEIHCHAQCDFEGVRLLVWSLPALLLIAASQTVKVRLTALVLARGDLANESVSQQYLILLWWITLHWSSSALHSFSPHLINIYSKLCSLTKQTTGSNHLEIKLQLLVEFLCLLRRIEAKKVRHRLCGCRYQSIF